MQKFLAATLTILMAGGASVRDANAAVRIPDQTATAATAAIAVHDAAIGSAAVDPNPQAAPAPVPVAPAHHSHRLRNILIITLLGAALLIGLAAADK